jgi:hypothetical protein
MEMLSILYLLRLNLTILFALILIFLFIVDVLSFKGILFIVKNTFKNLKKFISYFLWFFSIIIYFLVFWIFYIHKWQRNPHDFIHLYNFSSFLLILYLPKTIFAIFSGANWFYKLCKFGKPSKVPLQQRKSNSRLFQKIGLFVSFVVFLLLIIGVVFGRYRFDVTRHNLSLSKLPESFNNLKIVQISDLHIGTYINNPNQIDKIVSLINEQKPDMVFFTGDMVNSFAEEMPEFLKSLKNIHANIGKFAVLGNHDYGDYYIWHSEKERIENHLQLIEYFKLAGFTLLQNENLAIAKNKDTIYVAGTENWGKKPYRQLGNLNQTINGINPNKFILLLSHDPMFWDTFVTRQPNVGITFSGHTHGMQMGIKLGKFEWTPFRFGYKRWSGLFKENEQYLYVSKGLGSAMYTGRLGMWPEISVFELHTSK